MAFLVLFITFETYSVIYVSIYRPVVSAVEVLLITERFTHCHAMLRNRCQVRGLGQGSVGSFCMRRLGQLVLAFVLTNARAFVLYNPIADTHADGYYGRDGSGPWPTNGQQHKLSSMVLRWHDGRNDADPSRGLGGGITWAVHSSFCDEMLPRFRAERLFFGTVAMFSCDEIRAAISVALTTWSSNHPLLSFHDVTEACHAQNETTNHGRCPLAELNIIPTSMADSSLQLENAVAFVYHRLQEGDFEPHARLTNGVRLEQGLGLLKGEMYVSPEYCWYMDATFCSLLHTFVDQNNIRKMVGNLFYAAIGLAAALLLFVFFRSNMKANNMDSWVFCVPKPRRASVADEISQVRTKERCKRNLWQLLREIGLTTLHLPLTPTLLLTFLVSFLPVFYIEVFMPCYECHDFEATIAHETGHLLGFHHPDSFPLRVLRRVSADWADVDGAGVSGTEPGSGWTGSKTEGAYGNNGGLNGSCFDPLEVDVELVYTSADVDPNGALLQGHEDTLMMSHAAYRPRTCLTQDDYNGLHALYPMCAPLTNIYPTCIKVRQYSGYIRLAVSVGLPFIIATLMLLITQCIARRVQRRRVEQLEQHVHRQSVQQTFLRASLTAARAAKVKAEAALAQRLSRLSGGRNSRQYSPDDARDGRLRPSGIFENASRLTGRITGGITGRLTGRFANRAAKTQPSLPARPARFPIRHRPQADETTPSSNPFTNSEVAKGLPPKRVSQRRSDQPSNLDTIEEESSPVAVDNEPNLSGLANHVTTEEMDTGASKKNGTPRHSLFRSKLQASPSTPQTRRRKPLMNHVRQPTRARLMQAMSQRLLAANTKTHMTSMAKIKGNFELNEENTSSIDLTSSNKCEESLVDERNARNTPGRRCDRKDDEDVNSLMQD